MPAPFALVITAKPGSGRLTPTVRESVVAIANGHIGTARELDPNVAYEWPLAVDDRAHGLAIAAAVRAGITALIDINVVASQGRRKHLLISDMDSTIIDQECIDEMADVFGLKPRVAAITERAMRGELDFEAALRERLGLLAGFEEAALERVYTERITLMPGARTLVQTMKANGAYTALVSGGFTFFTQRVAKAVGFETQRANLLAFSDGRLTGSVMGDILGRAAKKATLTELAAHRGLPLADTLAVGDGANDLDMIRAAGLGVAYRAKPVVASEATAAVTHGDLTALLHLQGLTRAEFIDG